MKLNTKKQRERFFLDAFLGKTGIRLTGIAESETPDFHACGELGQIAIEISELFQQTGSAAGTIQAQESFQDRIVAEARAHYFKQGGCPARVRILFRDGMDLRAAARRDLSHQIASHVETLQTFDGMLHLLAAPRLGSLLAKFVTNIYAGSVPTIELARWGSPRAGFVASLEIESLKAQISNKERLARNYASGFTETWLLLVGDRTRNASKLRWPEGVDVDVCVFR